MRVVTIRLINLLNTSSKNALLRVL